MRIDRISEDRPSRERIDRLSERIDRIREDRSITKKKCATGATRIKVLYPRVPMGVGLRVGNFTDALERDIVVVIQK